MTASVVLQSISKSFGNNWALRNVNLKAFPGECLGILGENGAGKSTLMNVLSGIWPAGSYTGDIFLAGQRQVFESPRDAKEAGIAIIHQELALFSELSVAENIYISDLPTAHGLLKREQMTDSAGRLLKDLGFDLDPQMQLGRLSIGQRQLVEIAKALAQNARVLIFDEPTSALSDTEVEKLFLLIDSLKARGITCLYISHKFNEILRLCDRVIVLRDGESVFEASKDGGFDTGVWIEKMVGRKLEAVFPTKPPRSESSPILLEVSHLSYRDPSTGKQILKDVTFELREGEILGVAGLMGSKRSDLLMALFGALDARGLQGEIRLQGKPLIFNDPRDALDAGMALVTEDRKHLGLFFERSCLENMTLPMLHQLQSYGLLQETQEVELFEYYRRILRIKTSGPQETIKNLSGGNQQKVILGRCLAQKPKVLLLDEPTRGVDVNAKAEIYFLIRELIRQGLSIILVSSELPEIVALCDRAIVMNRGEIRGLLMDSEMTQEKILERAIA